MSSLSNMADGALTVTNILEHGARWHSDRTVVTLQGDEPASSVRFGELAYRAGQLAAGLRALGVGPGDRVGSLMRNTQQHLEAYFGVPAMGAVLHTINLRLDPEQLAYTINHAEDAVIVVDPDLVSLLTPILGELPSVRALVVTGPIPAGGLAGWPGAVLDYEDLLADAGAPGPWPELDERQTATLCYTTGTTGDPKGIAYSHRSIWLHAMSLCTANAVGLSWRDRGLILVPMFHANAWGYPFAAFWAGGELVLANRHLDPDSILAAIGQHRPTFANGVPTVWNDVLTRLRADAGHDISSLNRIVVGGAPLPAALSGAFRAEFGVEMLQGWGMTETSPLVTVGRAPADADPSASVAGQGRVLAGVDIRVVEPETGEVLAADGVAVGELELRGPWVADSYYRRDAADSFRDGWLRTGDVGTVDPRGYVNLTDRAKDVIKSGGEWISSVQLETLLAAHPAVHEAAVIGVPDERWDERPCAVVVFRDGQRAEIAELQEFLLAQAPKWWLPERWAAVEALPRTSVGKFDKKAMRRQYAAGELDIAFRVPGVREVEEKV